MYDSMMGGIPVVCAFDAPDTIIRQYGCGIQCDPENEKEVTDAIRTIRSMDPSERKAMGEKGREAVMSRFTYSSLAEQFLDSIR
jgi:glycosyltransferase involved in cell wall biosynthesis